MNYSRSLGKKLNNLLEKIYISENEFERAGKLADSPSLKNFFLEIDSYMENKIDFTIMGVSYRDDEYLPYGSFDNKKNKELKELSYNENGLKEVDWVIGCSVLINKNKFNLPYFFDDNIFFYF